MENIDLVENYVKDASVNKVADNDCVNLTRIKL